MEKAYPGQELANDWKKITFNDFHDLAAGSGIGIIYKEAQDDFDRVRWSTNEISTKALSTIAAQVDTRTEGGVPVLVFNPLSWSRSGIVSVSVQLPAASAGGVTVVDAQNRTLPSQVLSHDPKTHSYQLLVEANNVPSMGYKVLRVREGVKPFTSDLSASGTTMENAALKVVVDANTGCITSLFDKKSNFETLAKGSQAISCRLLRISRRTTMRGISTRARSITLLRSIRQIP